MNALRYLNNNRKVVASFSQQCKRFLTTDSATVTDSPKVEKCVNRVTLLGRVGKKGEIRGTSESPCIIFPLATNFKYKKISGEYVTRTDWHRICIFQRGLLKLATKIEKGDRIYVEGSLSHHRYQNEDNSTLSVTSVVVDEFVFLSKKHDNTASDESADQDDSL